MADTGQTILDIFVFLIVGLLGYFLFMWWLSSDSYQKGGKKKIKSKI